MNSLQRVGSLLTGKLPDQVPLIINLFDQGARELGMSLEDYYKSGENVARGQIALNKKFGHDCVWSMFYVAHDMKYLGAKKMVFYKDGPPNLGEILVKTYDDIEKLKIPESVYDLPEFQEQKKCAELLKNEFAGKVPVLGAVNATMTLPILLMGMEGWLNLLLTGPKDVRDLLLQKCHEFTIKHIEAHRKSGVDIIAYTSSGLTLETIPHKTFSELGMKWIIKDSETAGTGDLVYFNGGGKINGTISEIIDRSPFRAFYINPRDSISEAKEIINGRGLLVAPINDIMLTKWNESEIETEVKRIMDEGKYGGGFMMGTLMTPYLIPEKNIFALINAGRKHGKY